MGAEIHGSGEVGDEGDAVGMNGLIGFGVPLGNFPGTEFGEFIPDRFASHLVEGELCQGIGGSVESAMGRFAWRWRHYDSRLVEVIDEKLDFGENAA